ncbi:MAG: nucleoside kinase [Lachnospiraceae bacterium]|nr:nucleoside kinase [Lachnospiraceae bacterium]
MRNVKVAGRSYQIDEEMTYDELRAEIGLPDTIMLAESNYQLRELNQKISDGDDITFMDIYYAPAYRTYMRSANLLFYTAIYDLLGNQGVNQVILRHNLENAFYYEYALEDCPLTCEMVAKIESCMRDMVEKDLPIRKFSMSTDQAINYFKETGREDKVKLFKYRRNSRTNVYQIGAYMDYYYGYMVPNTGRIKNFSIKKEDKYIVMTLPKKFTLEDVNDIKPQPKLLNVLDLSKRWSKTLEVAYVGDINNKITNGDIHELVLIQEALQENFLSRIADRIIEGDKQIVLIAGPSSSGKTTFSNRLSIQLKIHGLHPHPIALDDFFVDREKCPKLPNGEYDFESIECENIELFQECMNGLLSGEEVVMPYYDFIEGKSMRHSKPLKIGPKDVLIIEGIHGLNPKMSAMLPEESIYKIYVSALSMLSIDLHNQIQSTDGRLLRRIVRDARLRGHDARGTIKRWPSVLDGEEANILPYQEEADVMYNSSQVYELAVLKQYVEPLLFAIPRNCPEHKEAKRLLKFLDYFLNIDDNDIPMHSIVREFIGGGCFKV